MERFGTSVCHYQEVMRLLSWDVPLGVVALNVSRRICLGITGVTDKHVEKVTSLWGQDALDDRPIAVSAHLLGIWGLIRSPPRWLMEMHWPIR